MSIFSTSATVNLTTLLPAGTTPSHVSALFSDHDYLVRLDPELKSYTSTPAPKDANPETKFYKVTDVMHNLPRGLWDTTISYEAEITRQDDDGPGLLWVIRAMMGLVQTSVWKVREGGVEGVGKGEGRLWLVEDVDIKGSRLIVGTVKTKIESNSVHRKIVEKLEEVIKEAEGKSTA